RLSQPRTSRRQLSAPQERAACCHPKIECRCGWPWMRPIENRRFSPAHEENSMNVHEGQHRHDFSGVISRRDVLKGSVALAAAWSAPALASAKGGGTMLAYVGAYTPN